MEGVREVAWCLEGHEVTVSVGVSRGRERVLSVCEHFVGVASGEAAGLGVEIKEDGIRFPPAQGPDSSLVNAGDEQGGGTAGAEAVGFNLIGRDIGDVLDGGSGSAQFVGDLGGGDVAWLAMAVIVGVEWSVWRGSMVTKVEDTSLASTDGAEDRVLGEPMSECFPTGCVLLVGVSEGDVYPSLHIIQGTLHCRSSLDISIAKGGVAEAEGLTASMVRGGREGVLAQLAEKEEANDTEVHDGLSVARFGVSLQAVCQGLQDCEVNGPDS